MIGPRFVSTYGGETSMSDSPDNDDNPNDPDQPNDGDNPNDDETESE